MRNRCNIRTLNVVVVRGDVGKTAVRTVVKDGFEAVKGDVKLESSRSPDDAGEKFGDSAEPNMSSSRRRGRIRVDRDRDIGESDEGSGAKSDREIGISWCALQVQVLEAGS